jgi:hypothetical protein
MKERIEASEYFAILPESILFAPISSNAIRLYCILRRRADEKTNACYPSQNYLAKNMYCSVRTVQRALEELVNIGAVTVEHRYLEDTDAYTSNMYYLHATIAQGSAYMRKGMADMSQGYGADVVQNIANKQSKETNTKKKSRKRDLLFEEMCNGLGIDWKNAPKGETGRVNAALKDLRPLNITPEELKDVIEHYKKNWKVAISATAISNNWTKLKNEMKEAAPVKQHDCETDGHVWIDTNYSGKYKLYICQFCRKEKKDDTKNI